MFFIGFIVFYDFILGISLDFQKLDLTPQISSFFCLSCPTTNCTFSVLEALPSLLVFLWILIVPKSSTFVCYVLIQVLLLLCWKLQAFWKWIEKSFWILLGSRRIWRVSNIVIANIFLRLSSWFFLNRHLSFFRVYFGQFFSLLDLILLLWGNFNAWLLLFILFYLGWLSNFKFLIKIIL